METYDLVGIYLLLCIKKGIIFNETPWFLYFVDALSMNINKKKSLL